jgi:hypothetical protein
LLFHIRIKKIDQLSARQKKDSSRGVCAPREDSVGRRDSGFVLRHTSILYGGGKAGYTK